MSKLTILAISISVLYAFGVGWLASHWYASTEPVSIDRYCADYENTTTADGSRGTLAEVSPPDALGNEEIANPPSEKEKYDLCQQWRMAEAAQNAIGTSWFQIFISCAGLLGLILTVIYAAKSAKAAGDAAIAAKASVSVAREIGQKQVRAYLSCDSGIFYLSPERLFATIIIKNYGQSPARNVRLRFHGVLWEAEGAPEIKISIPENFRELDSVNRNLGTIFSGSEFPCDFNWSNDFFREVGSDLGNICVNAKRCKLGFILSWNDVFVKTEIDEVVVAVASGKLSDWPVGPKGIEGQFLRRHIRYVEDFIEED